MDKLSGQQSRAEREIGGSSLSPGGPIEDEIRTSTAKASNSQHLALVTDAGKRQADLPTAAWNPAPRIPQMILEPDVAQLMAADELGKSHDQQLKTLLNNLKFSSENLDEVNKKKMDKLHDRMKKVLEQIEKQKQEKVASDLSFGLGMAASILALIGAALLTFVTMGAAAPALVGAAIGAATTVMDGIDRGLKDAGVKFTSGPLAGKPATATLAGLIGAAYEAMMVSDPAFKKLPEEEQQKRIAGMQTAVMVLVSTILLGIGIGSAAYGVTKLASEGVKVASTLSAAVYRALGGLAGKGAELAQVIADTANSASTMSSSVFGSQLAHITFESNELDNQKQYFEALAEAVERLITTNQDALENVQQSITDFIENVAKSNERFYDASRNIIISA